MTYQFNVQDRRAIKRLYNSGRFPKYPDMFLSDTCKVKVNNDDYLFNDEFTIKSKYRILPRKIYLYGKKTRGVNTENNLYLNYWLKTFLNTVESGNLYKQEFEKSDSKIELTIGLPIEYRANAFNRKRWTRKNVIAFLSCLFDNTLEEINYEQQDLLESLLAA